MTDIITIPLSFILALGIALYFVPVMRRAAVKWGVVDKPDGRLKTQREPVAYLGGVGVYIAFLLSLAFVFDFSPQVLGLLLGGTIMLLIGLVDDFGVLTPFQKLAGQFLATFVLIKAGIVIQVEFLPVWVTIPLTVLWIVGIINAVNILDISDGLSSGVAFVACVFLAIIAVLNGNPTIAILTAALAGALGGFLFFNFHPAKIYLGDTGSLFIGLMLGALAMVMDYSKTNHVAYLAPVLILGVPIFETAFVMLMRAKKGLPVFLGSPDHYAIRLKRSGWTTPQVAFVSYGAGAVLGGLALALLFVSPQVSLYILGGVFVLAIALMVVLNRLEP
jgi:UDP-GlcNAc:undecaprenyl-phosphate GlcNAc-1-phosphate transferase